jgi:hypothetical protein
MLHTPPPPDWNPCPNPFVSRHLPLLDPLFLGLPLPPVSRFDVPQLSEAHMMDWGNTTWTADSLLSFFCETMLPRFDADRPEDFQSFLSKSGCRSVEAYRKRAFSACEEGDAGTDEIGVFMWYTGATIVTTTSAGGGLFVSVPTAYAEAGEPSEAPWPCPPGTIMYLVMENAHWSYLSTASSLGHKGSSVFPAPSPLFLDNLHAGQEPSLEFFVMFATWTCITTHSIFIRGRVRCSFAIETSWRRCTHNLQS